MGKVVFSGVDAIRGVAAIWVVLLHCQMIEGFYFFPRSGYLAVDVFFVLSGFVIEHSYAGKMREGMSVGEFALVRFIRLYPIFIFSSVISFLMILSSISVGRSGEWNFNELVTAATLSIAMLPNFNGEIDHRLYPLNGPAWSVFFELIVNISYVLLFRFISKKTLILVISLFAAVLVFAIYYHGGNSSGYYIEEFWIGVPRVLFSFYAGVFIYRIRRAEYLSKWMSPISILLVSFILFLDPTSMYRKFYDVICVVIVFPVVVWIISGCRVPDMQRRIYAFLGLVSYALYLIHQPLLKALVVVIDKVGVFPPIVWCASFLVGIVLVAWGIDLFIDRPLRKALTRTMLARSPRVAAA